MSPFLGFGSQSIQSLFIIICSVCLLSCSSLEQPDEPEKSTVEEEAICLVDDENYQKSLESTWEDLLKTTTFSRDISNKRIQKHLDIFERRQKYFNAIGHRSEKYLFYISQEVQKRKMPAELAFLPIIESGMDPFAYSHGRAAGMWQFIPSTAKIFDLDSNWWYEGRRDVVASTDAALNYLERLGRRFDGDWLLALAAYNSGSGTVYKAIKKNKKAGLPYDYWSLDLPKETSDYVPKLIALTQVIEEPARYGIKLTPIFNTPKFVEVDPKGQIDLAQAAALAETPLTEMYLLNPGYNRWATEPKSKRQILIPYEQEFVFQEKLQALDHNSRLAWKRYTIKSGDSLSTIAHKHHINTEFLKQINHLNSSIVRIGKTLLIPSPLAKSTDYTLSADQRNKALSHREKVGKHRITYKVKANDSFWSIARKYNVGIKPLAAWNGMAPKDNLRVGREINVWLKDGRFADRKVVRKVYYTVRNGESISHVAAKFGVSINNVISWNDLEKQKYLQPGQKLVLNVNVAK